MADLLMLPEARLLAEPFHALWRDSYRHAEKYLRTIREFDPENFLAYETSTLASMMRDQTVRRVRLARVLSSGALGTFTQILNAEPGADESRSAIVRFKELDTELHTFNHTSGRQRELDRQELDADDLEQLQLHGVRGGVTLLTCGYVRDFDPIVISRIVVVCHYYGRVEWFYELETEAGQEVLRLPGSPPPQSTVRSRIVRPKKPKPMAGAETEDE